MNGKQTKCYTYIRVSTEMQVDGYSLEAQKNAIQKYADFQHMQIAGEYCDAGKSGKSITGRPEFMRMLDDVSGQKDGISYILVFKLSRFGRNAADVLNSLQYIQDYGVNLISVQDGIDSSRDSGKLTITVLSAVAEIERENILVQTMEGRRQKAREGKWNGGQAPFGYDLNPKTGVLTINEKDAEAVRTIFDRYVMHHEGFDYIASYMNRHGYSKEKKKDRELSIFTVAHIKDIISNPVYIGKIKYGENTFEKVKGSRDRFRRVKNADYPVYDGLHEPIISQETWDEAQRIRQGKMRINVKKTNHVHILSGIVKCPLCGRGLAGNVRKRRNKNGTVAEDYFYRCNHGKRDAEGHRCTYSPSWEESAFDAFIEQAVLDTVRRSDFGEYCLSRISNQVNVSSLEEERSRLQDRLRQATGARNRLLSMMEKLDPSDRHYDRKVQDMQDRLDGLYDKISEAEDDIHDLTAKIGGMESERLSVKEMYEILRQYDKLYAKMSPEEKKTFYNNLIRSIELDPDERDVKKAVKEIRLRFPIAVDGEEIQGIRWAEGETVETVCLLSKLSETKSHISVKVEMYEMDLTAAESKATYQEIQDWVQEKYGFHVTHLNIAQVKRKYGIIERENYNKPKSEDSRQPGCPAEKIRAIEEALMFFRMI